MPKRQTPRQLATLLTQGSGNLAQLAQKSKQISDLNHFLAGCVGDTIAQNCRVSNYSQGILTIETDNSAFATRLQFMSRQILTDFRQNVLPDLADLYIKVLPGEQYYQKSIPQETPSRHLSEQAGEAILAAASHAPESLRKKLERLAAHAEKGKK